jgi:hypothetical protein
MPPSTADVAALVAALCGGPPDGWAPGGAGGYSPAGRWVASWRSGRRPFVKAMDTDWGRAVLAREARVYGAVDAPHLPRLEGFDPGAPDRPAVLVLEDLSEARWGAPVTRPDAEQLAAALDALAATPPPAGLPAFDYPAGWAQVAQAPARLVASGLVDGAWLDRHLPALLAAEAAVTVQGGHLVHGDLFVQNRCRADRGAVLVDWGGAAVGAAEVDRAWGEAGVRAAGGPAGVVLPAGAPCWAAWMAGQSAWYLVDHDDEPHPRLAEAERREALATLRWACAELELPPPPTAPGFAPPGSWRP